MFRKKLFVHLAFLLSLLSATASAVSQELDIKEYLVFQGKCRFQVVRGFVPCDPKVFYARLGNSRSFVSFIVGSVVFSVSGGSDRQPNLENFYLSIDTIRATEDGKVTAEDKEMEGECHFRLNKDASKFFFVKCDVYNRQKGVMFNFYLENIRSFIRKP